MRWRHTVKPWARLKAGLDLVLPPRCFGCGARVQAQGLLCGACWRGLTFLGEPCCRVCGYPFDVPLAGQMVCGSCLRRLPRFDRARAVLRYDDASRRLVLALKHGDRSDGMAQFGRWLARAGEGLLADADAIVPVPLHRWRLWRRRYNQSALLAHALSRATGVPAGVTVLVRRRATHSQGGLSRSERVRNVAGAFAVPDRHRPAVRHARIVLVDDVLTTGATAEACAAALKRAGAARVDLVALTRVVQPSPEAI